jgi:ribosomal protein S18 acetylase RimI-like enzyme
MAIKFDSLAILFEDDTRGGLIDKQELKDSFISYIINISHINIDNICELVIECQSKLLIQNLEKINDYDINQGFLFHKWSIDSLKELLSPSSSSSSLICIIDNKKNKLVGYLLLTSITHLVEHVTSEFGQLELDKNIITDEQWKQLISSPHIHYIEQTGVDAEYHRLGIGSHLIALAKNQSNGGLCTCVTCWPYCNSASANLKIKNGFQSIATWNQTICPEFVPFKATIYTWPSVKLPSS